MTGTLHRPAVDLLACTLLLLVAARCAVGADGTNGAIECPPGATFEERSGEAGRTAWCEDEQGRLHGPAGSWYANGRRKTSDHWVHGREHGRWLVWDERGARREERYYVDGDINGVETKWYADGGKRSVAYFESGAEHGRLALWNPHGLQVVEGRFRHGSKHGIWTIRGSARMTSQAAFAVMIDDQDATPGLLESAPTTCQQWLSADSLRVRGLLAVLALHSLRSSHLGAQERMDEFPFAVCLARESGIAASGVPEACRDETADFRRRVVGAAAALAHRCADLAADAVSR